MSTSTQTTQPERVYSVLALTQSVKNNLLANNPKLKGVWIEGEVSGLKAYGAGHLYFTLKDAAASISCVIFAYVLSGSQSKEAAGAAETEYVGRSFRELAAKNAGAADGKKVRVSGELQLNVSRGQYSFKVTGLKLLETGMGEKMAEYLALKAKLTQEGLNKLDNPALRRRLPFLPRRIAMVTSISGAVLHDMCDVIGRRFPDVEIRVWPAKVQGDGAAQTVVAGLRHFNGKLAGGDLSWRADVIIVARGGGSVEDLWAFNDEELVREVAASEIPVISAVGHESDVTLCDHAADLRAGTPSIAAERVVPVKAELLQKTKDLSGRLVRAMRSRVDAAAATGGLVERLRLAILHRYDEAAQTLDHLVHSLGVAPSGALERAAARLSRAQVKLEMLNPYAVLSRGYSITTDADGNVVRSAAALAPGAGLSTLLAEGRVASVVTGVEAAAG